MERKRADKQHKPRELKPSVRRLIIYRAITQRKLPRDFLAHELIKEINESGEIPPSLETAKRYISRARNTDNPIDKPWTIGSCSEYGSYFPPESIPFLMECKQFLRLIIPKLPEGEAIFTCFSSDFSIRDAIWIARLQPIIHKIFSDLISSGKAKELNISSDHESLVALTFVLPTIYSFAELTSEIMREDKFDTSDLDNALFTGDLETLARKGIRDSILKSKKVFHCDNNCKLCRYQKVAPGICTPKKKDGEKCEEQ